MELPASLEVEPQGVVAEEPPAPEGAARRDVATLLFSIFAVAGCGLMYELLMATVSSYLLGNGVTQFSIAIGVFIGAMGIGSHLSQRFRGNLLQAFIGTEIALGLVGGSSVSLLMWSYAGGAVYYVALYGGLVGVGILAGLELPLLTRILRSYATLRKAIAQALSIDYVGALAGSLLLPLLLLPLLGMTRTAFVVGLVNVAVAGWNLHVFGSRLPRRGLLILFAATAFALLAAGAAWSTWLVGLLESRLYEDRIIYATQTPYQRIVVTRWRDDTRLFLDGNLQFSSTDEYRYHECLVHPAMSLAPSRERVLVLGGGDGLGVREVLKHEGVREVVLVDIDSKMTDLGRTFPPFTELNKGALLDPRVRLVHEDAHLFLDRTTDLYNVILADLPDPNTEALAKLYSKEYYRLVKKHLAVAGVFATQATSPYFSRDSFWCIAATMAAAELNPAPYHAQIPSFGEWGFILGAARPVSHADARLAVPTKYLTQDILLQMGAFGADVGPVTVEPSTLDRPTVQRYYLEGWKKWE